MVKKYSVSDIQYDLDEEDQELDSNLPSSLVLELDDASDPQLELADAISDATGWCVVSFSYESLDHENEQALSSTLIKPQ